MSLAKRRTSRAMASNKKTDYPLEQETMTIEMGGSHQRWIYLRSAMFTLLSISARGSEKRLTQTTQRMNSHHIKT